MKKGEVYKYIKRFHRRNPGTIAWRLKAHSKVAEKYINHDEEILYAFASQKGPNVLDIVSTHILVFTDKRLILAQKRLIFGHFYYNITPEMFDDFTISMGLIWGNAIIDILKERIVLSNISKNALREIETVLSKYVMQKKREIKSGKGPQTAKQFNKEIQNIAKYGIKGETIPVTEE